MDDLISRQAAIDAATRFRITPGGEFFEAIKRAIRSELEALPSAQPEYTEQDMRNQFNAGYTCGMEAAQPEQRWIPFTTRQLTEEEKEEHPEWDCILDCKLPDDGQRILVAIRMRGHEEVQQDEFYSDDGSYLDSGYAIGTEAVAWMPLPEPYKGKP